MPELPEVETIVSDLRKIIVGEKFVRMEGRHANSVSGAIENEGKIVGMRISSVERRGKFMNIFFENDYVMTLHLRMSGRLVTKNLKDEELPYERTRLDFSKTSLRFCDIRKFGKVWINKLSDYEVKTGICNLGVEPFSKEFNFAKFLSIFKGKRGTVKKNLLDQSLIAGIGNIYADEGCFYAGIRPNQEITKLSKKDLERLYEGVLKALRQGIKNRGTSISDFVDAYGKTGRNQEVLFVYGRGGKKCINCREILQKTTVAGRGTVFCTSCQK
ncbi:MAG: bifunctional DNA-formamidopyrimidine glycosylase/DNA-(apurinic or apyrimidinic site) lyase [Patescibacteria group bacterium]